MKNKDDFSEKATNLKLKGNMNVRIEIELSN